MVKLYYVPEESYSYNCFIVESEDQAYKVVEDGDKAEQRGREGMGSLQKVDQSKYNKKEITEQNIPKEISRDNIIHLLNYLKKQYSHYFNERELTNMIIFFKTI